MPQSLKRNLDKIIVKRLKDKVIKGEWKSGQRIMIDELAEEFQVSRTPVLQAVRILASERMLTISSSGRVYVPEFSMNQVSDICRIRLLLESEAIKILCEKEDFKSKKLWEIAEEFSKALKSGDEITSRHRDLDFHKALVNYTDNDCLSHIYVEVQGQFAVSNFLIAEQNIQKQRKAGVEHYELLHCIDDRNVQGALDTLEAHIKNVEREMLKSMKKQQSTAM